MWVYRPRYGPYLPPRPAPATFAGPANAYSLSAAAGSFAASGQAAGLYRGSGVLASAGTFAESGQTAGLLYGHRLTASAGSSSESGQAAGLLAARVLTASAGTFALAGGAATLAYSAAGRNWPVGNNDFESPPLSDDSYADNTTLNGVNAWTFSAGGSGISRNPSVIGGTAAYSGLNEAFLYDGGYFYQSTASISAGTYAISFACRNGSFSPASNPIAVKVDGTTVDTITPASTSWAVRTTVEFAVAAGTREIRFEGTSPSGGNVSFIDLVSVNPALVAAGGTFSLAGNAAGLTKQAAGSFALSALAGTFAVAGGAAGLLAARRVAASAGSFAEAGDAAGLYRGYRVVAAAGTFAESGQSAGFLYGRLLSSAAGTFALAGRGAALTYQPVLIILDAYPDPFAASSAVASSRPDPFAAASRTRGS